MANEKMVYLTPDRPATELVKKVAGLCEGTGTQNGGRSNRDGVAAVPLCRVDLVCLIPVPLCLQK
jgi:hypothetical protein